MYLRDKKTACSFLQKSAEFLYKSKILGKEAASNSPLPHPLHSPLQLPSYHHRGGLYRLAYCGEKKNSLDLS